MEPQAYLQIENNIVTNIVMWDGGPDWIPPSDATMLILDTTPAMVWTIPTQTTPSVLEQVIGAGQIEFTWNGSVLTTNLPQPIYVPPVAAPSATQPKTTGTQAA